MNKTDPDGLAPLGDALRWANSVLTPVDRALQPIADALNDPVVQVILAPVAIVGIIEIAGAAFVDGSVGLAGRMAANALAKDIGGTIYRGPAAPRLPQDIARGPVPPQAVSTNNVARTASINKRAQADIANAKKKFPTEDIRTNQEQVTASGVRVGRNKPDTQLTIKQQRITIEYDPPSSSRGIPHAMRAKANDPSVVTILVNTGK